MTNSTSKRAAIQIVRDDMEAFGIRDDCCGKFMLYWYIVKLDGKWCLKSGRTIQGIQKRIIQYLYTEHRDMSKDMTDFNIIALFEYETSDVMHFFESFIKNIMGKYPLNKGQHKNTEQWSLQLARAKLADIFRTCEPLSINSWIMEDWKQMTKDLCETAVPDVKVAATTHHTELRKAYGLSSSAPLIDVSVKPPKSIPAYVQRLNDIYAGVTRINMFNTSGETKSFRVFKEIYKSDPFETDTKAILCSDIKAKMQSYNSRTGSKVKYNCVIDTIMCA